MRSHKFKMGIESSEVKSLKEGGKQIEFEDELPEIREMFEKELAELGLKCQMPVHKK
jgi:hypothetical protein